MGDYHLFFKWSRVWTVKPVLRILLESKNSIWIKSLAAIVVGDAEGAANILVVHVADVARPHDDERRCLIISFSLERKELYQTA